MLIPTQEILEQNVIGRFITGSQAYGTSVNSSDVDEKAIVILPLPYHFSLGKEWESVAYHKPDIEYHTLKKVFNLLTSQNPTILEMLYSEPRFIIKRTPLLDLLIENRKLFLSANIYFAYGGMASRHINQIKVTLGADTSEDHVAHMRDSFVRILHSYEGRFRTNQEGLFSFDTFEVVDGKIFPKVTIPRKSVDVLDLNAMLSEFANAVKVFNKTERGQMPPHKLGKDANHVIRILTSAIEVLEDEYLQVYRDHDRDLLLSIRREELPWSEVFAYFDMLSARLEKAYANTKLPKNLDYTKINGLYQEIMIQWLRDQKI